MRLFLTAIFTRLTVLGLFFLLMVGCRQEPTPTETQTQPAVHPLKIGIIPEQDIFSQKKRYEPLMAYLSKQLGIPIEISILPHYENLIKNFNELGLDGAFFGSLTAVLAINNLAVEPLVRPQYPDGASTYYGVVFVRKGSGIHTAQDMKGKRMVFVDMATTAGYLLPLNYFKSLGINDYQTWFRGYYFSGTHTDAILDVLNGVADVGAAKSSIFELLAANDGRVKRELEIIATSPRVPTTTLAVRHDLANDLKQALKRYLLEMHQVPEGRAVLNRLSIAKFIETTAADFQPVIDYAASAGLDLRTGK
jgi:phosphonate transport system substrate-binding protein